MAARCQPAQEDLQGNGNTCVCPPGQFGDSCDLSRDFCHPETCSGQGDCGYSGARVTCTCHIGRTGESCEEIRNISTPAFSGESFVSYPAPKHVLRRLTFKIKFKPKSIRDSVLVYAGQNVHFCEIQGDLNLGTPNNLLTVVSRAQRQPELDKLLF